MTPRRCADAHYWTSTNTGDATTDWSTSSQADKVRISASSSSPSQSPLSGKSLRLSPSLSDPLTIRPSPKPITIYIQHQQLKLSRKASKEALFVFSISTLYLHIISPLVYALSSSICSSSYSAILYSQPSVSQSVSQLAPSLFCRSVHIYPPLVTLFINIIWR